MRKCCLCNKKEKKETQNTAFFKIPKDEEKKRQWEETCGIMFPLNSFVCLDHFQPMDYRRSGGTIKLMPNAVPTLQPVIKISDTKNEMAINSSSILVNKTMTNKVKNLFCAVGCPPGFVLHIFPNKQMEEKRRKYWLNFFDLEEPNTDDIYACGRHFSHLQRSKNGLLNVAVPDIPSIISEGAVTPFKRKPKNWRNNVVVVTPRDPEYTIYRNETGVFSKDLFNNTNSVPIIKSISCSVSTQTNKHLCGTVEISDICEEYRLNCFYCSEMFPLDKWKNFQNHLKLKHFQQEVAFERSTYLPNDHDYTPLTSPPTISPQKPTTSLNGIANPITQIPQPITLPPLIGKPEIYANNSCHYTQPPPLLPKPLASSQNNTLNISLADKLINLLNETILNPIFLASEEDNIIVIKNNSSNNIETSSYLTQLMEAAENGKNKSNSNSKIHIPTLNQASCNIRSNRPASTRRFLTTIPKDKYTRRIAKQTLKNINIFENIYKTVKKRLPRDIGQAKDPISSEATELNIKQTPLSRCLKRSDTLTIETVPEAHVAKIPLQHNSTELVFEYTPEDIMFSLLDYMKEFPVLWEFHKEPFNKDYAKAVVKLCQKINEKWSLNITCIKMIRSINRIIKFYRVMSNYEKVEKYTDYYNKCAQFLPLEAKTIPHTRCAYCWICFKRDGDLNRHMARLHNCLKWPYKCRTCFERFKERNSYEMHKRLPHYKKVFKCDKCLKHFDKRSIYRKHYSEHLRTEQDEEVEEDEIAVTQPITYPCDKCPKEFKSINLLNVHKKFCPKPKKTRNHKCHLCPKAYFQKTYLDFHLKKHYEQYDYMCEVCGRKFIRQDSLQKHMEIHTGAKITCNICNLKLRRVSLSRHLRLVHVATEGTIESTFRAKCYHYKKFNPTYSGTTTTKRLRSYGNLPRNYKCKICKIHFSRLKALKDHNKLEHPDVQKIPCKICRLEFKQKNSLKRHYLCKHKLHPYQTFKLLYQDDDVETVLSMKLEELDGKSNVDCINPSIIPQTNETEDLNNSSIASISCSSDQLQDEIMKAVENIDEQQMKIDDEHSMNDFFGEFLK